MKRSQNPLVAPGAGSGTALSPPTAQTAAEPRTRWVRPRLERFGEVRSLTMGTSPGVNESTLDGPRFA